jgi:uncharacterized protein YqhQ
MMRSTNYYAIATRAPSDQIVVMTEPLDKTLLGKLDFLKRPFLRGVLAMLDTMLLGVRAMRWSANIQVESENLLGHDAKNNKVQQKQSLETAAIALTVFASLVMGFVIFKVGPESAAQWILPGSKDKQGIGTNYIAEIIKVLMFIGYLALIRRYPPIYEIFRYHGAEHKAISVIEDKKDLTVENAMPTTRLHPRCGTNFAIIVLLIGFLFFPLIPRFGQAEATNFVGNLTVVALRLLVELAIIPIVAGISYEIIRAAGRAKDQRWVNILLKPGLATQLITTAEPAEKHIEVAIASLSAVMEAEKTGSLTNIELDKALIEEKRLALETA